MIKFDFPFGVSVSLNTRDRNATTPIIYQGDPVLVDLIRDRLSVRYGAYGHQIGSATTPIDLNHAMLHPEIARFKPRVVDGAGMVRRYAPGIPSGVFA